jgi:hypothetical protein
VYDDSTMQLQQAADIAFGAGVLGVSHAVTDVPVDVVHAAILAAENAPDLRKDRVELAIVHLDAGGVDAHILAQAMISTIIADAYRS